MISTLVAGCPVKSGWVWAGTAGGFEEVGIPAVQNQICLGQVLLLVTCLALVFCLIRVVAPKSHKRVFSFSPQLCDLLKFPLHLQYSSKITGLCLNFEILAFLC